MIDQYLPAETLSLLYRVGIRIEHLRRGDRIERIATDDPLGDVAQVFREMRDRMTEHAQVLRELSPDPSF